MIEARGLVVRLQVKRLYSVLLDNPPGTLVAGMCCFVSSLQAPTV
jgi:hypothetical protein